jgi:Mn2+/Fe2+ NRAMP family transporter
MALKHTKPIKKLLLTLSAIGPGLFLIGYNIGTGSITTMAKAGAEHGMSLFWALVLSCLFTFILMVAYGKVTLVSGHTALWNIKHQFSIGPALAIYILIALVIGELLAIMGVMGIVVELLQEGLNLISPALSPGRFWITLPLVIAMYLLLWVGHYKQFEKVLTFFVILMGLCFIIVFFLVKPDFEAILSGLAPSIPDKPGAYVLVAAMAGTTCSAAVFIVRSTVVAEKGWSAEHLQTEKRDALVSASMMLLLSGIIMAVSAGTLHIMGLKLTNTLEMIRLFEPLGGKAAAFILILGIAGAGLSTVFPIILIAPWLICDYMGKPRNIQSPLFRITGLIGILFGFGFLLIPHTPPLLMVISQAFQACILPAVAIPIFLLINKKNLMRGTYTSPWMNIGLVAVIVFSLVTTWFAIMEFLN